MRFMKFKYSNPYLKEGKKIGLIYHECDADLLEHYILKPLGMEEIVIRNPQEIFISFNIISLFVFNFSKSNFLKLDN